MSDDICVCGEPATATVLVHWAYRPPTRERYCEECALDVVETIEGTEVLP